MFKTFPSPTTALVLAAAIALSGCVAPAPQQIASTAAPAFDPSSGIATDALVAVSYLGSEKFFVVFYLPAKIDAAQKAAAPAKMCASQGLRVKEVEDKPLEHPEELPGTMKLVVRCK
jgi:hypothetical protein